MFLTEYNLHILFLVLHRSDQTQPLDLGIFSVQKGLQQRLRKPEFLSPFVAQIFVAKQSIEQASTVCSIINAIKAAGIVRKVKNSNPFQLALTVDFTACTRLRNPLSDVHPYKWPLKNLEL